MRLKDLLAEKGRINADIKWFMDQAKTLASKLDVVESEIETIIEEPVKHARQISGKDTGTVDVLVQGVMVKHNLPKKVVWDKDKLAGIRQRIIEGTDDPDNYMDVKTTYSVKEKAFKSFPPSVKAIFETARQVKAGTPKINFNTEWR